jgi:hypothetical protein
MRLPLVAFFSIMVSFSAGADKSLHLPIGDPGRKDKEVKVVLDAITDAATGALITPKELAARLGGAGMIFLGESHTSMNFHLVQQRVIEDQPIETVRASYADFIWGIPPEKDSLYPDLGIAMSEIPGETRRKVLSVSKDGVGQAAGFEVGDVLIFMDDSPISDREVLNNLMAAKRWGDTADFVVRRGDQEVPLHAQFRRRKPAPPH